MESVRSLPIAPDLSAAIAAVAGYRERKSGTLSQDIDETISEILIRLGRLACQATELIAINNRMLSNNGAGVSFDPESETVVFSASGFPEQRLKLTRADPDVPIQLAAMSQTTAYKAGSNHGVSAEDLSLRVELEVKLESYYQSAHRVLKLCALLPMPKIKSHSVTRVRNDLIDHPNVGALYTFGASDAGPRVKPMHRGAQKFNDDGLIPNTEEFVSAVVKGFV